MLIWANVLQQKLGLAVCTFAKSLLLKQYSRLKNVFAVIRTANVEELTANGGPIFRPTKESPDVDCDEHT